MENHFVIGLGGTGGKVIRSLRKRIYTHFRADDPDGVNLAFLYVDSSDELMDREDPTWKTLGRSVQLPPASQLLLEDASLRSVVANVNGYPSIKPWIGDKTQLADVLPRDAGARIFGGQRRRLGRFLFANRVREFNEKVAAAVRELTNGRDDAVTFHVCAGLAGGTGSGSVSDVIAQVRNAYPRSAAFRILVYAFLPEEHPIPAWNSTGWYHANGYGALLELNALAEGRWKPHDVAGGAAMRDPIGDGRLDITDPFQCCYLFSNVNDAGQRFDVETQVPDALAGFLFQKIIALSGQPENPLARLEQAENAPAEMTPDRTAPERSRRFFTFGIKQVAYPEEEIREYLTAEFVIQGTRQLLFNHWDDEQGFLDQPKPQDFVEVVRLEGNLSALFLTDRHLTLAAPILESETAPTARGDIKGEWAAVLNRVRIQELGAPTKGKQNVGDGALEELKRQCNDFFQGGFRRQGVAGFFQGKALARKEHAARIIGAVERKLVTDLLSGTMSLDEGSRFLRALSTALEERRKGIDGRITDLRRKEEQHVEKLRIQDANWARIGTVAKLFGKRNDIFNATAALLEERYLWLTQIEAWGFGKALLGSVLNGLEALTAEWDGFRRTVAEALDEAAHRARTRCAPGDEPDPAAAVVRLFDAAAVRTLGRRFTRDPETQKIHAAKLRTKLGELFGNSLSLARFNASVAASTIADLLDKTATEEVESAHGTLQGGETGVLNDSIVHRLQDRFGRNEPQLRGFITSLVKHAAVSVQFDNHQVELSGPGITPGFTPGSRPLSVLMPEDERNAAYRETLARTFVDSSQQTDTRVIPITLTRQGQPHQTEIVLLSVTGNFPARFIAQVGMLRKRYQEKVNGPDATLHRYVVHLEGDGSHLPSLFPPDQAEIAREGLRYALLGLQMGAVTAEEREGYGTRLYLHPVQTGPIPPDLVELGPNLLACRDLTPQRFAELRRAVEGRLPTVARTPDDRRRLQEALGRFVEEYAGTHKRTSDEWRLIRDAAAGAAAMIPVEG